MDDMFLMLGDKPSDEIADGDRDDDRELEDEDDANDDIVDDNGFSHQWLQLDDSVKVPLTKKEPAGKKLSQAKSGNVKYSDEIADGDKDDDKELEDTDDENDHCVDENGYVMLENGKYSDELANGDEADDKDIHEDEDMNDDVVDVNGHTNAGYGSHVMTDWVAMNHIMPGSHIQEPRLVQLLQTSDDVKVSKGAEKPGDAWAQIQNQAKST